MRTTSGAVVTKGTMSKNMKFAANLLTVAQLGAGAQALVECKKLSLVNKPTVYGVIVSDALSLVWFRFLECSVSIFVLNKQFVCPFGGREGILCHGRGNIA